MSRTWQDMAKHLGLETTVKFSGFLSQPDCARRLQAADVFVLPSLFECGGAVVLEAMAVGLPVIATAWGGPLDYLDNNGVSSSSRRLEKPSSKDLQRDHPAGWFRATARTDGSSWL